MHETITLRAHVTSFCSTARDGEMNSSTALAKADAAAAT
jgi:hypothetical protein